MRHQLLVSQHGKTADMTKREVGLPAGDNHQIPAAEVTDAVQLLKGLHFGIQRAQQRTASFHIGEPCEKPGWDPLCGDRSPLRTADTDKAMGAPSTTELLQPDTSDDAAHRETKQIHLQVITPEPADVIIELLGQSPQGNSSQTVRKMGNQQRNIMRIQATNQSPKKVRRIPEPMDKNERTPGG